MRFVFRPVCGGVYDEGVTSKFFGQSDLRKPCTSRLIERNRSVCRDCVQIRTGLVRSLIQTCKAFFPRIWLNIHHITWADGSTRASTGWAICITIYTLVRIIQTIFRHHRVSTKSTCVTLRVALGIQPPPDHKPSTRHYCKSNTETPHFTTILSLCIKLNKKRTFVTISACVR